MKSCLNQKTSLYQTCLNRKTTVELRQLEKFKKKINQNFKKEDFSCHLQGHRKYTAFPQNILVPNSSFF